MMKLLPKVCIVLILTSTTVHGQDWQGAIIGRLDAAADTGFKQYLASVELARQRLRNTETRQDPKIKPLTLEDLDFVIYAYTPEKTRVDFIGLAAACNIPLDGIVTLNRIAHVSPDGYEEYAGTLLLPSAPGLFIPEEPNSELERLISSRIQETGIAITVNQARFRFIPGAELNPTESVFLRNSGFRSPLDSFKLTSPFGRRRDPISGRSSSHNGLDLSAPVGTEVYATRGGVVTELGQDTIYGKYVIVKHTDNWVSLYGHLSKIDVSLQSRVESGTIIGRVGSTGRSTGPHLHFELRQNGKAQDPGKYLFGK
jgi:hypothetical protein